MNNETEFKSLPSVLRGLIKNDELSVKQLHYWAGGDDTCTDRHIYNVVSGVSPVTVPMLTAWLIKMPSAMRLRAAQAALGGVGLTVSLNEAEGSPDLMESAIKADDAVNHLLKEIHRRLKDRRICGGDSEAIDSAADLVIGAANEVKASLPRKTTMRIAGGA